MLIDNVVSLTFGTLENNPSVKEYFNIACHAHEVTRGDLFIVTNNNIHAIDEAVSKGAYALLYESDMLITDHEIAWIRVDSVYQAVQKILRHQLLHLHVNIRSCDTIYLDLIALLHNNDTLITLHSNHLDAMIHVINRAMEHSLLLIDTKLTQIISLIPACKSLQFSTLHALTVLENSLFESSFIFDGRYYERIRMAPWLLPYLEKVLNFLKRERIPYLIQRLSSLHHFEPLFVNRSLQCRPFGSTERVIIFQNDDTLFNEALTFLTTKASWATIIVLTPSHINIKKYDNVVYLTYENSHELIGQLRTLAFNFVLLLHHHSLKAMLEHEKHPKQLTFAI